MKKWEVDRVRRIANALAKAVAGCGRAFCPFRSASETEEDDCGCREKVRDIRRQLNKEYEKAEL